MMTSTITYQGNLRTSCRHLKSGKEIITDAPTDNHGKGEAFSPTDLLATSLGSCMITIMGITAQKHNIEIDGTKINITKIMAENPRRVSKIIAVFEMKFNREVNEKEKNILENAARACPVAKSIHPEVEQEIIFNYF
ncbi:MAG: OsmC family protein [Bacteroidota bacterium]